MKISITIDATNAAFDGEATSEVADILTVLTQKIRQGYAEVEPGTVQLLRDSNGNRVGFFKVKS